MKTLSSLVLFVCALSFQEVSYADSWWIGSSSGSVCICDYPAGTSKTACQQGASKAGELSQGTYSCYNTAEPSWPYGCNGQCATVLKTLDQ